jgi:hypothetical protein
MKAVFYITSLLILSACATHKDISTPDHKEVVETESTDDVKTVGIVRITDKGCFCYLEVNEKGVLLKMYPVNLDEKYKKEGTRIQFTYHLSRAMQPENCFVDKVIAVDDVTELR